MPSYRLTYFNSRGVAECSRLMFKLKEQDFEDVRLTRKSEELETLKAKSPTGQFPLLEIEGLDKPLVLCQSRAIERYLARKFGKIFLKTFE